LDVGPYLAAADVAGQVIGPQSARAHFANAGTMAFCFSAGNGSSSFHSSGGLWFGATNRYLGVKFSIDGETHYGWARFNAGAGYAQLTGYAYETVPNKPIPAGVFETPTSDEGTNAAEGGASLGKLARGAAPAFQVCE